MRARKAQNSPRVEALRWRVVVHCLDHLLRGPQVLDLVARLRPASHSRPSPLGLPYRHLDSSTDPCQLRPASPGEQAHPEDQSSIEHSRSPGRARSAKLGGISHEMDSIEPSAWHSIVRECPLLTHGNTPTISDEQTGGIKPIRVILPNYPYGGSTLRVLVSVHGPRVTAVQLRTRCGSMKADPAEVGSEATSKGAPLRRTNGTLVFPKAVPQIAFRLPSRFHEAIIRLRSSFPSPRFGSVANVRRFNHSRTWRRGADGPWRVPPASPSCLRRPRCSSPIRPWRPWPARRRAHRAW